MPTRIKISHFPFRFGNSNKSRNLFFIKRNDIEILNHPRRMYRLRNNRSSSAKTPSNKDLCWRASSLLSNFEDLKLLTGDHMGQPSSALPFSMQTYFWVLKRSWLIGVGVHGSDWVSTKRLVCGNVYFLFRTKRQ